jgi:hypothetical protein
VTPNNSTCTIACALCVGGAREPYLAASLDAIADVVDVLVVNDNSGLAHNENVVAIEASPFGRTGRLRIASHPFVDFAQMRNDAQGMLSSLERTPDWVLFIDADEVHGEQVRYLAHDVLPRLGEHVGRLDAYTYHFFGTFAWITDIARRMAFYRFSPALSWVNPVHEKLSGLRGRAVVVPYIYHHYGNVLPPRLLAEKHQRYYALGNPVERPPDPDDATLEVYLAKAAAVRPFRGPHPHAARASIAAVARENAAEFAALDAALAARRGPGIRARASLQSANEALRICLRRLEHPGLYRAPTVAR